jgi:hypothetical protein
MVREFDRNLRRWTKGLAAAAVLGWTAAPTFAQTPTSPAPATAAPATVDSSLVNHRRGPGLEFVPVPSAMPSQSCPPGVTPGTPGTPPAIPGTEPGTVPPAPQMDAPGVGSLGNEAGGAGGGAVSFNTPNIMGNFLGTQKVISFSPGYVGGGSYFLGQTATTVTNAKIADNNSPVPRDRIGYRYDFYSNSNTISGLAPTPSGLNLGTDPISGTKYTFELPFTKSYDTQLSGLDFEKTFANGNASIEVRVPIVNTAASHQTFNYGQQASGVMGIVQGVVLTNGAIVPALFPGFLVNRTSASSLGHSDTEMGNMQVILKGVIAKGEDFLISGGVGVGVPTAEDTKITVTDYSGAQGIAANQMRTRVFDIQNQTWGVSPFLAGLYAPKQSRWFTQGFLEFETPVNSTGGSFAESVSSPFAGLSGPIAYQQFRLREQALMHLSWSSGFWAYQNPEASWITGIAPMAELHYTQSLTKGRQVALFDDQETISTGSFPGNVTPGQTINQPGPTAGRAGNVDFIDVTLGTTFEISNRATLAVGFAFPLLSGEQHRTFDYELQFQFNYYFGAGLGRRSPNIQ